MFKLLVVFGDTFSKDKYKLQLLESVRTSEEKVIGKYEVKNLRCHKPSSQGI